MCDYVCILDFTYMVAISNQYFALKIDYSLLLFNNFNKYCFTKSIDDFFGD